MSWNAASTELLTQVHTGEEPVSILPPDNFVPFFSMELKTGSVTIDRRKEVIPWLVREGVL